MTQLAPFLIPEGDKISHLESFRQIADSLMNRLLLQVNRAFYRIVSCEFYYTSEDHPDPYTHGHKRQKESNGQWYFHGSGLDITLAGENGFGGILLTGIARINDKHAPTYLDTPVFGPVNVCTELFANFGSALTTDPIAFGLISGRDNPKMPQARIFEVPRVGLNRKRDKGDFHDRNYRFISFLHLPHKKNDFIKRHLCEVSKVCDAAEFKSYKDRMRY
jgi:hypothetical protein